VASSFEDFDFVGWYCGDTLVSTSSSYSFIVTGDRSLTARFAYSVNNCTIGEGDLPDTTDFDDVPLHFESEGDYCYRTTPFCWYIFEQDSYWQSYIYVDQFWDNDGDYNQVLYFSSSDTTGSTPSRFCMLPPIDSTAYPLSTLQLSFMMYNNSYSGNPYVEVGVLTDPDDTNSFIPIQTVYATNSDEFVNNTILFQDYSGPHGRITFKFPNPPTGYSSLYIDDVILEVIPTCPAVQNPLFNNITAYSIPVEKVSLIDSTATHEYKFPGDNKTYRVSEFTFNRLPRNVAELKTLLEDENGNRVEACNNPLFIGAVVYLVLPRLLDCSYDCRDMINYLYGVQYTQLHTVGIGNGDFQNLCIGWFQKETSGYQQHNNLFQHFAGATPGNQYKPNGKGYGYDNGPYKVRIGWDLASPIVHSGDLNADIAKLNLFPNPDATDKGDMSFESPTAHTVMIRPTKKNGWFVWSEIKSYYSKGKQQRDDDF
jgi:uncharacterized repeat protein (TIGR02543 family)